MKESIENAKPLRMRHMLVLEAYDYKFKEFLFLKEDAESYVFYNIPTGMIIALRR